MLQFTRAAPGRALAAEAFAAVSVVAARRAAERRRVHAALPRGTAARCGPVKASVRDAAAIRASRASLAAKGWVRGGIHPIDKLVFCIFTNDASVGR